MEINGKVYRNLPQQVLKNQEDILALQSQSVDSYTKAESDAKFETKEVHQADFNALNSETDTLNQQMATANTDINNLKKASGTQATAIRTLQADVERIDQIVPTDIAVHEGKLGLEHNTTWLTNQNAITLGDGLTYDEATKTLKAKGGDDNTLIIFDYPVNGKLTDEQFNMIKANPSKYVIRKKTWDKKDQLFLNSTESDHDYKIVYADDIVQVNGQSAILGEHHIVLDENNKSLLIKHDAKSIVADYQKLPQPPSDASTSTYALKLVNGTSTWVAGGGSEATLPTGTEADPFHINNLEYYSDTDYSLTYSGANFTYLKTSFSPTDENGLKIELSTRESESKLPFRIYLHGGYNSTGCKLDAGGINFNQTPNGQFRIYNYNKFNGDMFIPVLQHPSTDGKYILQITRNNEYSYHYDWVAGGGSGLPTYRHFVKLSGTDGTYEGELYITVTSTNGNTINNLTDFDTVMTNFVGTVECSGYYTENLNDGYPIIRLMWEGTSAASQFSYLREGALVGTALSKLTIVDDRVVPA